MAPSAAPSMTEISYKSASREEEEAPPSMGMGMGMMPLTPMVGRGGPESNPNETPLPVHPTKTFTDGTTSPMVHSAPTFSIAQLGPPSSANRHVATAGKHAPPSVSLANKPWIMAKYMEMRASESLHPISSVAAPTTPPASRKHGWDLPRAAVLPVVKWKQAKPSTKQIITAQRVLDKHINCRLAAVHLARSDAAAWTSVLKILLLMLLWSLAWSLASPTGDLAASTVSAEARDLYDNFMAASSQSSQVLLTDPAVYAAAKRLDDFAQAELEHWTRYTTYVAIQLVALLEELRLQASCVVASPL